MNQSHALRRRISVASFGFRDLSQQHKLLGIAGACAVACGASLFLLSSSAGLAKSDALAAGRALSSQAVLVQRIVQSGSLERLDVAAANSANVAAAFRSMAKSSRSIAAPGEYVRMGGAVHAMWTEFSASLNQIAQAPAANRASAMALAEKAGALKIRAEAMMNLSPWASADELPWVALATTLAGLALVFTAVVLALRDVEFRYTMALTQFRSGERARDELIRSLTAMADSTSLEPIAVAADSTSDVGMIVDAINRYLHALSFQVSRLQGMHRSAAEHAGQGKETAKSTLDQIRKTQDIVEHLRTMLMDASRLATSVSSSAKVLSANAEHASIRIADATLIAQDGEARLEATRDGISEAARRVKHLGEMSQEISLIVDSLQLIAGQSSVLSLNASLEAERAGDAGAGFRLLAQEMASLSKGVDDVTSRIADLVAAVQADARSASEAMDRSASHLAQGVNVSSLSQALVSVVAPLTDEVRAAGEALANEIAGQAAAVSAAGEICADLAEVTDGASQDGKRAQSSLTEIGAALSAAEDIPADRATH